MVEEFVGIKSWYKLEEEEGEEEEGEEEEGEEGQGRKDLHAEICWAGLYSGSDAEHVESQDPHHVTKDGVHLNAVAASALLHDFLEEILCIDGQRAMGRVVKADGFKGHTCKMVSLKLFEELELISRVLRARIRDVL